MSFVGLDVLASTAPGAELLLSELHGKCFNHALVSLSSI